MLGSLRAVLIPAGSVAMETDGLQCLIPRALAFSEDRRHVNFGQSPTSRISQQ